MTQLFLMIYDAYICVALAWHVMTPVIFHVKLNLLVTQLEYISLTGSWCHRIEFFPVQPHLPLWEGLYSVRCHSFGQCLQQGKVMGVRYPGPVSRHNLVRPLLRFWYRVPMWDNLCLGHDGGRCVFGRHGATQD